MAVRVRRFLWHSSNTWPSRFSSIIEIQCILVKVIQSFSLAYPQDAPDIVRATSGVMCPVLPGQDGKKLVLTVSKLWYIMTPFDFIDISGLSFRSSTLVQVSHPSSFPQVVRHTKYIHFFHSDALLSCNCFAFTKDGIGDGTRSTFLISTPTYMSYPFCLLPCRERFNTQRAPLSASPRAVHRPKIKDHQHNE